MDLGLRSMAPSSICLGQPPAVYHDQYTTFASSTPRDATSPKGCGFKAWAAAVTPGPTTADQRPTILFQLLQHEDLSSGDEFHQMEHSELDYSIRTIAASGKPSRSFSTSAESTRTTATDGSRSPSQGSVASSDGTLEDGLLQQQVKPRQRARAESFLESTRTQLLSLTTRCSPFEWAEEEDGARRKDTCSSAPSAAAQASPPPTKRRSSTKVCPSRKDLGAIDLTCKRRCSRDPEVTWEQRGGSRKSGVPKPSETAKEPGTTNGTVSSRPTSAEKNNLKDREVSVEPGTSREPGCSGAPYKFPSEPGCTTESGISGRVDRRRCCKDSDHRRTDATSILKSILTGRSRSQSFSGAVARLPAGQQQPGACVSMTTGHQRVALAKRNMMPVLARIADRLSGAIGFARSLPEFLQFPEEDQALLLVQACPRLLLLYLAEDNFQFAVTPVRPTTADPEAKQEAQEPTIQFVETVQNFIGKCQTQSIGATEYFYMRMIVLFHTGSSGALLRSDLAKKISSEAVQDLHALVGHLHGDDKLRYSRLLLTLYTLFGINGSMVEALFCSQISPLGGIRAFVEYELRSSVASSEPRSPKDSHGEK